MARIKVEVVAAGRDGASVVALSLEEGSTAAQAVAAAGLRHTGKIGVFGKVVAPGARLADGDRVELYRPLTLDPKEARRRRAKKK
jgi:putative ubiquitin-RnfH superfamily antitoxin RatB of RatAB toxin-antitoxin module